MPLQNRGFGKDPFEALQAVLFQKMREARAEKKADERRAETKQSMQDIINQEINNFNSRDEQVKDSVNESLKDGDFNAHLDNVNTDAVYQENGDLKNVKQPISNTPDEVINNRVKDNVEAEHEGIKLDNVNTASIRDHVDEYGPDYDYTVNGDGYEREQYGTQQIKGDSPISQDRDDVEQDKEEAHDDYEENEEKADGQVNTDRMDTHSNDDKDDTAPIDTMPAGQTDDSDSDTASASPKDASKQGKYKVKEWQ